jgi:beta-lactamase regulating signal transducer with metallopeptidase domain
MIAPGLQSLAQVFTERLLNTAAEGVVLAGIVWLLLRLVGRQNSSARFAIWFAALLAVVALPFFGGSGVVASRSSALPLFDAHREFTLSSSWALCLFAAWALGAGILLLRLAVGLWRVRRFRRNCSEIEVASLDPEIAAIVRDFQVRGRVRLCVSDEVALPAAVGFFRPAIVFPAALLPQLSPEEIKIILLHELAHLRRWDDWTNLAQKVAKAVFFFHPAVWWIENRLTLEREMACDDMVLAQTASARAYASSLISFAEKLHSARTLALAQALVSRMHQMSQRVTHILDAKRPSHTGLWKPVLGFSAGIIALVFGAAPYMPRFVAVETQPAATPAHSQTQFAETRQRVATREPSVVAAAMHESVPVATVPPSSAQQPRAIPAVFNPRSILVKRRLTAGSMHKATPRQVNAVQASDVDADAVPSEIPVRATFMILRTTQVDASGARVWTLCVWRVGGNGNIEAEREMESVIVLSLI